MGNLCYAPFIHNYIHPNDGPRVCCASSDPLGSHTPESLDLEKHWQSKYYQDIRKRMLAGEKLNMCDVCWGLEDDGIESDRQMYTRKYKAHGSPKLDIVHGTEIGKPLDLDIRPSNLCNLKCRMCTPKYSSQLEKEQKKNPYLFKWTGDRQFFSPNIMTEENIKYLISGLTSESDIKFLGGEPTIMPEVSQMLDRLIDAGKTDCHISITTNCTNFNNQEMFNKLKKFETVGAQLSIDGTGKTLEYIRSPLHWDKAQEVITQWIDITNDRQIHFTLQALNLFNVYDFLFWLADYNKAIRQKYITLPVEFYVIDGPDWSNIRNIPVDIRHKEVERILNITDPFVIRLMNESDKPLSQCLKTLLNDSTEGDLWKLARATKDFDTARNQHIKDYIPIIYSYIEDIYKQIPSHSILTNRFRAKHPVTFLP